MANRLKILRDERKLTQDELAALVKTTQPTIQRIETGVRKLNERWIMKLATALQCHPGELFAPLPIEIGPEPIERQAVMLARRMSPDQRATWFQVGAAIAQSTKPSSPKQARAARAR